MPVQFGDGSVGTEPAKPGKPKPVTHPDGPLIVALTKIGIICPTEMLEAARAVGLPVPLAASILMQESGGGFNVFGHDPTIFAGQGQVTEAKYLAYKAERKKTGESQGVGPCQLTYSGFQDEADAQGGCWVPLANMKVGFGALAANIRRDGERAGVTAYNGTGPTAERYADTVLSRAAQFAAKLPT